MGERGYEYDCSTLPTYIAPLARAYYFFKSPEMSDKEREKRKKLFGKFADGFQTLKPHLLDIGDRQIVEIPVTTMPVFKVPIHVSYLIYLATFSPFAAKMYWRISLALCRATGVQPSLLLHPLDFLCGEVVHVQNPCKSSTSADPASLRRFARSLARRAEPGFLYRCSPHPVIGPIAFNVPGRILLLTLLEQRANVLSR